MQEAYFGKGIIAGEAVKFMLNVEHLSVNYGYITALTDISFHVEEGEIITLIGSNGAGKTTTLGAISGWSPR